MADNNNGFDVIIVGSGAAGLAASLYAGRYKMKVLTVVGEFGGETATAGVIHNYPGVKDTDGYELMKIMREQAGELGVTFKDGYVQDIQKTGDCFSVKIGNVGSSSSPHEEFRGNTVIFAVGTERRRLGLPKEKELTGKGVHFCITCDGPLYAGKTIAIVGGGDASVKGVNLAAEYAQKIYLVTIEKELRAEPINFEEMKKLGDKVEVIYENTVKEIVGDKMFEKAILDKEYNGSHELDVDGLFVEIGAVPNVDLAKKLGVLLDQRGYIMSDNMMVTNIPGVFAAGDTVNLFGAFKQDITAAAMGAVAATSAYQYRKLHGDLCEIHARPEKAAEARV